MTRKASEAAGMSSEAAVKSARAQVDETAKQISNLTESNPEANTRPLDVALTSDDLLDRIAQKISVAGEQPEVYYIPTTSTLTWVVFSFKPRLLPLTFRVAVDVGSGKVGTIEDPYIREKIA